jgi:hypothetical protein
MITASKLAIAIAVAGLAAATVGESSATPMLTGGRCYSGSAGGN